MSFDFGSFNNWGTAEEVAIRDVDAAFVSDARIDAEWKDLNYHSRPDLANARTEYKAVEEILAAAGAEVIRLPAGDGLTLDSIYTHDALIVTPRGLVQAPHGQAAAAPGVGGEWRGACEAWAFPSPAKSPARARSKAATSSGSTATRCLAGIGYRTNLEGVRQLGELAGEDVEILWFDMPHYKGRSDVFHLMSCCQPLDHDLAVVYPPLMAARQIEFLESRGIRFVEVPAEEFDSMGCNVLALGPRHAMMVEGNPETERRMRAAGVKVEVIKGYDICRKGEGGPTCMTRPLVRG